MNSVTVTGTAGSLRYGYHVAATVGAWAVTLSGGVLTLQATLVKPDHYRLSQRPLVFVAPVKGGSWRWPVVGELQRAGASCTAVLGPQEE